MSETKVTVAVVHDPADAVAIRRLLEDDGIPTHLADAATPGIQIRVPHDEESRARRLLAKHEYLEFQSSEQDLSPDEPEAPPTPRERAAEKALLCAVFGLVVWPLWPYGIWLLLKAALSAEPMRPQFHRKIRGAVLVYLTPFAIILFALAWGFMAHDPDEDLLTMPHPAVMAGTWKSATGQDEIYLWFEVDGRFEYRRRDPARHFEGFWGFHNKTLTIRFRRGTPRDLQGNTFHYALLEFARDGRSMKLDTGNAILTFTKVN